jgi:hypothetical protein
LTEVNQLAISEDTIKLLFIKLRDGFKREKRDGVTLGQLRFLTLPESNLRTATSTSKQMGRFG